MTAAAPQPQRPFDDVVLDRTGADAVARHWLSEAITSAARGPGRFVLVTGEPGAGKTSLVARLARDNPGWLRYFLRRDSVATLAGTDVRSFLLSIGHELATLRPELFAVEQLSVVVTQEVDEVAAGGRVAGITIDDLTISPFHQTAVLRVEQRVGHNAGVVGGIEIGTANLEPRLLEPANLAALALTGPAEVLRRTDPTATLVILLDGLDEAVGQPEASSLLDWLTGGAELPPNVRVVITSRPVTELDRLRSARAGQLTEIAIDPQSREVVSDLVSYAERELGDPAIAEAVRDAGTHLDDFHRQAVRRADGNFLHISAYARALRDAVQAGDAELSRRLIAGDEIPSGLAGLYTFFVGVARADLERSGALEIQDPTSPDDRTTRAWEGLGQPLLGVLTVAREPLSVDEVIALGGIRVWPRAVHNAVARLRWLLDRRPDGRISFMHASVGEFLASEQVRREHPDWGVELTEWNERIVRHYRGASATWETVDFGAMDRYGLVHLCDHVVRSRAVVADQAPDLVCPALRGAVRGTFGSDRHFIRVIELAAGRVTASWTARDGVPAALYLAVVRRQVLRAGSNLVPAAFGLLTRMGRRDEALERLAALTPSTQRLEAHAAVLDHLPAGDPDRPALLEQLADLALALPGRSGGGREGGLRKAALALAPVDLPRALRLWSEAGPSSGSPSPDDLYRAAIAAAPLDRALSLVPEMASGRAGVYLDLADRAAPPEVPALLSQAERNLAGTPRRAGLPVLARLAVAWAPFDPDRGRHWMGVLLSECDRPPAEGQPTGHSNGDRLEDVVAGMVEAAGVLVPFDVTTAKNLLARLQHVPVNGLVEESFLRAGALWAELGQPEWTRWLVQQLVQWNAGSRIAERAKVLATFAPAEARALIDRRAAAIPASDAAQSLIAGMHRDGDLRGVALALADHDLDAAERTARQITRVTWQAIGDRYSTLVELAHRHLDHGRADRAGLLLAELLRTADGAPSLTDPPQPGPYRPAGTATAGIAVGPADTLVQAAAEQSYDSDWERRRRRRFYLDPAKVMEAMTPGPSTVAHPYSWARTVRAFAEATVDRDLPYATELVRTLSGGERAVGMAAMFRAAPAQQAGALWAEFNQDLARIPAYEMLAPGTDDRPFAYVRPDHRYRFDAAVRIMWYEADTAKKLLAAGGATFLSYAFEMAFGAYATGQYSNSVLGGGRPHPAYTQLHRVMAGPGWSDERHDPLLMGIVRARALANEYGIVARAGRPIPWELDRPTDPLLFTLPDLTLPANPQTIGEIFAERMQPLLGTDRLPAVAGLAALAAGILGGDCPPVLNLSAEIVAAAERATPGTRACTLLEIATSPELGHLVDTERLIASVVRTDFPRNEQVDRDDVMVGLLAALLPRNPAAAMRLLYDTVVSDWPTAMAQLETGAPALVNLLGVRAADTLQDAILRALRCISPEGIGTTELDGVRVADEPPAGSGPSTAGELDAVIAAADRAADAELPELTRIRLAAQEAARRTRG